MNSDAKKILKIGGLAILLIFIAFYAFFRSKDLLFGVKIRNTKIDDVVAENQTRLEGSVIKITGNAKNAVELTLNNRLVSIDQKGDFAETLALYSGYNIISIVAKDAFGNVDQKIYKLIH